MKSSLMWIFSFTANEMLLKAPVKVNLNTKTIHKLFHTVEPRKSWLLLPIHLGISSLKDWIVHWLLN